MKQRILTSILLLPLLFFALISEIFLYLFMLSIFFLIIIETNLFIKEKNKKFRMLFYFILIAVYYFLIIYKFNNLIFYTLPVIITSFIISLYLNILELKFGNFKNIKAPQYSLFQKKGYYVVALRESSTLFFLLGISTVFFLYESLSDLKWILIPLMTVFSVDTFSYIFGSIFGKKKIKFISKISPNKTIVGYVAGISFGIAAFIIFNLILGSIVESMFLLVIISIIFPILAITGDLYASAIKRNFGLKNYGNIFPGHGGLLDRLDSVILVLTCMTIVKVVIV